MMPCKWEQLPLEMQKEAIEPYYILISKKKTSLFFKRCFDIIMSLLLLLLLSPLFLIFSVCILVDSKGSVFYRQERVTVCGKHFKIFKFRTMVTGADRSGSLITLHKDTRITRMGAFLRKYRLDELPQLLNILTGDMSFVGVRPEVPKYVKTYTGEMLATLLLPAGVTSPASIYFKGECNFLRSAVDVDKVYIQKVLPAKMKYNLMYIQSFSFWNDIKILLQTVFAVCGKTYSMQAPALEEYVILKERVPSENIPVKQSTKNS